MDQAQRGLSQEQENDCRAAMQRFIDRHELSDWETIIKVQETVPAGYSVRIEIAPPPDSGLPSLPVEELAVVNSTLDVAAEVEKLLEAAYQAHFKVEKTP